MDLKKRLEELAQRLKDYTDTSSDDDGAMERQISWAKQETINKIGDMLEEVLSKDAKPDALDRLLSIRTYELIVEGFKSQGMSMSAYTYIEERLRTKEADKVRGFMEWIIKNNRTFGSVNYQKRWKEYLSTLK